MLQNLVQTRQPMDTLLSHGGDLTRHGEVYRFNAKPLKYKLGDARRQDAIHQDIAMDRTG